MKTRLISLLAAIFATAVGFNGAPATAGPSVSLTFSGFLAVSTLPLTFGTVNGVAEQQLGRDLGLEPEVIVEMDGDGNPYGAVLGLSYEITVDDPSPGTPREWLLAIDLGLDGVFLAPGSGPVSFDESTLGITGPLSGIPITDLTGLFSVHDLAMLGAAIFNNLISPCAGPPAVDVTGLGTCLYLEDPGGPLSGDLFAGLTPDFTEELLDGLGLPLPDEFLLLAGFEGEATLTTAAVSEPGTFAVLGLGLAAVGFARRRRSR